MERKFGGCDGDGGGGGGEDDRQGQERKAYVPAGEEDERSLPAKKYGGDEGEVVGTFPTR